MVLLRKKFLSFLDSELKSVIKDSYKGVVYKGLYGGFIKKLKNIDHNAQDAVMVTTDVVGLYPNIPNDASLEALRKALGNRVKKTISANDLTKMTEFIFKNNYFEFDGKVKKHISGLLFKTHFGASTEMTDVTIF